MLHSVTVNDRKERTVNLHTETKNLLWRMRWRRAARVKIKVTERNERDEVAVLRGNLGVSTEILKRSLAMGCVLPALCLQDLAEFHIHRCF